MRVANKLYRQFVRKEFPWVNKPLTQKWRKYLLQGVVRRGGGYNSAFIPDRGFE